VCDLVADAGHAEARPIKDQGELYTGFYLM
jgi:hypothetical protein